MSEARIYCSELARTQGVSLAGTAEPVDVWILLEHRGPWSARALDDNDLPAVAQSFVDGIGDEIEKRNKISARVQLIKQPDRTGNLTLIVAHCGEQGGVVLRFSLSGYEDLQNIDVLAALNGSAHSESRSQNPVYLVCTNGQRDLCCARFGLPVFATLHERWPDAVWQTTHVGGHRYAPNVICLPLGAVFGFAMPEVAPGLLTSLEAGRLELEFLRGQSFYEPAVQLAAIEVRRQRKLFGINDLRLVSVETPTSEHWRIRFMTANGPAFAEIEALAAEKVQASCGDNGIKPQVPLRLKSLS